MSDCDTITSCVGVARHVQLEREQIAYHQLLIHSLIQPTASSEHAAAGIMVDKQE
jgi:hypothetical protein